MRQTECGRRWSDRHTHEHAKQGRFTHNQIPKFVPVTPLQRLATLPPGTRSEPLAHICECLAQCECTWRCQANIRPARGGASGLPAWISTASDGNR